MGAAFKQKGVSMKKKLISTVISISLTAMAISGCGSAAGQSSASTAQSSGAAETAENTAEEKEEVAEETAAAEESGALDEDVTLTVWCWDPAFNINAMQVAERIYQEDHPNFSLDIQEISLQDIFAKLSTSTTSGDLSGLPDIFLLDDSVFASAGVAYPEVFTPLNDTGFDFSQFSASKVATTNVGGIQYGIPFDNGTAIAAYRTDILEEAGYTIEDLTDITWDEFLVIAKDVLDKTGHSLLNGMTSYMQIGVMMKSAGASYFTEDGAPNLVNNEVVRRIVEIYAEMVQDGIFIEETGTDTYIGGLNTGRVAGTMNGCWIMASLQAAEDQSGLWAITNVPRFDEFDGATNYSAQGGSSWAISSNCKNVDAAVDFLQATFGGSKEFYDEILPSGAIATWLPAGESDAYNEPVEFYGGQPVFRMITEYSEKVPVSVSNPMTSYAANDVGNAITNYLYSGYSLDDALQAAEENLAFEMGQ